MKARSSGPPGSPVRLRPALRRDLDALLPMVRAYHRFEGIRLPSAAVRKAIVPLLGASRNGRIWLVEADGELIGYAALCFGYSIEFLGRDAFLDELFVVASRRGRGIGVQVMAEVAERAARLGVRALHLEVAQSNRRGQALFRRAGLEPRSRYLLMSRSLGAR